MQDGTPSGEDRAQAEAFAERQSRASLAALELANVELGLRLGLYDALAAAGPAGLAPGGLAARAGIVERYAREWLEQQAVAEVVQVDDPGAPPGERRFTLPSGHAHALLDEDSESCVRPHAGVAAWLAGAIDIMATEFRAGAGVDYAAFGGRDLQTAATRPTFATHLAQHWLPAMPDVVERVERDGARVAELGCGTGLAALAVAAAHPAVRIDGFDLDRASVEEARRRASAAGVADRVQFHVRDAADATLRGRYDLVIAIEVVHDVPDPVGTLRTMARLAAPGGAVLVVEDRAEERFTVPASELERALYCWSTLHCLAVSMQDGGAGTGTVMRPATLRAYAAAAGFADVEVLDVDHPQFTLYRLRG
jgi:2-polyprenyl-3-methyl-5-hydroxy-6-metoxy-1,4-benzoquinol methylase